MPAKKAKRSVSKRFSAVTPGELLWEEFMSPYGLTRYRLAKEIGVPAQRIGDIVNGNRSITADTDLRLSKFFGVSDGYWLRAQAAHDLEVAQRKLAPALRKIKRFSGSAA
jgi:addiction module HigA family antidote